MWVLWNMKFWLTLRISMARIWFDVLKCPRSWSFTQILRQSLPRIWGQFWSELLRFYLILGQSFSQRCTLINQWVLPWGLLQLFLISVLLCIFVNLFCLLHLLFCQSSNFCNLLNPNIQHVNKLLKILEMLKAFPDKKIYHQMAKIP